jgi:non-ribosomal peptide synthetase component F
VPGELYTAETGWPGYWNRPELTKEKFIPNPFDDSGPHIFTEPVTWHAIYPTAH